jgi:hypothetical protein
MAITVLSWLSTPSCRGSVAGQAGADGTMTGPHRRATHQRRAFLTENAALTLHRKHALCPARSQGRPLLPTTLCTMPTASWPLSTLPHSPLQRALLVT